LLQNLRPGKLELRSHPHLFTILLGGLGSFLDRMATVRGLLPAFTFFFFFLSLLAKLMDAL